MKGHCVFVCVHNGCVIGAIGMLCTAAFFLKDNTPSLCVYTMAKKLVPHALNCLFSWKDDTRLVLFVGTVAT